jgi:hypothetical protein
VLAEGTTPRDQTVMRPLASEKGAETLEGSSGGIDGSIMYSFVGVEIASRVSRDSWL